MAQLVQLVKEAKNRKRGSSPIEEREEQIEYVPPVIIGYLAADLAASTDPDLAWSSQPSADVNIYIVDSSDGSLADTSTTQEVFSRRDTDISSGTFVEATYKDNQGKWMLTDANCNATDGKP